VPFSNARGGAKISLSSTWGRADQQASHDSMSLGRFVLHYFFPGACGSGGRIAALSSGALTPSMNIFVVNY
jgi:hypothetical protein